MRTKVALAVSTALLTMSTGALAEAQINNSINVQIKAADLKKTKTVTKTSTAIFTPEKNLKAGKYRYIVQLVEAPAALYEGGIKGYKATALQQNSGKQKFNVKRAEVKAYRSLLSTHQNDVINQAQKILGKLDIKQRNTLAFNGFVVEMTQDDAQKLALVPGIAHIQREVLKHIETDSGPQFIKADQIWDGSANGTATKGEGMLVGIIDTGVNTDHPSFADIGADGYDHTNPFGEGNYIGDCATEEWAGLCNDKLVGVVSYPEITDQYADYNAEVPANGEDHNGHGSHTASTVAGNVLNNVDSGAGFTFDAISGVAPHANIISYQVCLPGENDAIGFAGCFPSLTVKAVENAIENGVDVLNYSIGGGSSDPWHDADSLAFLSARKAGIHVATSAGNSGPGPETVGSPGDAPWITTVAAGSHDRQIVRNLTFNEQTFHHQPGTGPEIKDVITGPVIYAGVVDDANFEGCNGFAADSFKDSIALISRGSCSFVDKVNNAVDAGATAVIVFNNKDGDATITMAGLEDTTVPSVMVSENTGAAMVKALADTPNLTVSIDPQATIEHAGGGVLAGFSSRGPNKSVPDVIAPSITAPGLSIFAAFANSQPKGFKENPDPSDYAFLQGTSMASPHIAGALTLLAKVHPDWTPAEAQSALMLTANQNTLKEDGVTPADFFDMGSGFANVAAAAATGLVMDESIIDYLKADPNQGGQPKDINLPTMANAKCVDTCTWTRTVKATRDGSWSATTAAISENFAVTVTPASFTLKAGETQTITVTADVTKATDGWNFANVVLTSDGMPEVKMPVAAKASTQNLPASMSVVGHRDQGSLTFKGLIDTKLVDPKAEVYVTTNLMDPTIVPVPDGAQIPVPFSTAEDLPNVLFDISSDTAPDVDLYLTDLNINVIASSATASAHEMIALNNLPAGDYYLIIVGYTASSAGATDDVLLKVTTQKFDKDSLSSDYSVSLANNESNFDLTFSWQKIAEETGVIVLSSGDDSYSTQIPFSFSRGEDDVQFSGVDLTENLTPGVAHTYSYTIAPNLTQEDKVYNFAVTLSEAGAAEVTNVTGVDSVNVDGGNITWSYTQKAGTSDEPFTMNFDFIPRKAGSSYTAAFSQGLGDDVVESLAEPANFSVIEVAPVINIAAPATVTEGSTATLDASGTYDANADSLTYSWKQLSGTPVSFNASANSISFTAPQVNSMNEVMSFELTVSDGNGNVVTQTATFEVRNKKSSGSGSFGWLLLASPLVWLRRKLAK